MPDRTSCEILKKIQDAGYIDRVFLSMDITRKSHLEYAGGLGYSFLLDSLFHCLAHTELAMNR